MEQYDFLIIDNHENILYFKFIRNNKCEVKVCCPHKVTIKRNKKISGCPYGCIKPPFGEIVIPSKVEFNGISYYVREIDRCAFYDCRLITKIVLPETITKIGPYAFNNCIRLDSINIPNRVEVIGDNAFQNCESLKEIYTPNSLKELGRYAFDGCKSLVEVVLSNVLLNIKGYTFRNCLKLENINVPLSLLRIYSLAFENCIRLRKFEIPASIYYVSRGAFCGCNLKIRSLSDDYVVKDNCLLYRRNGRYNLLYVPRNVEEYEVPEGVWMIQDNIFSGCKKLRRLKLADSVRWIDMGGFSGCNSLQEIMVSDNSELSQIGSLAFFCCHEVIRITLPSSLKVISRNAFSNCALSIINKSPNFIAKDNALYTVDYKRLIHVCSCVVKFRVDNNVEVIDSSAFSDCRELIFVILPQSFDEVPRLAFPYLAKKLDCIYTLNQTMEAESYTLCGGQQIPVKKIIESDVELLMKY